MSGMMSSAGGNRQPLSVWAEEISFRFSFPLSLRFPFLPPPFFFSFSPLCRQNGSPPRSRCPSSLSPNAECQTQDSRRCPHPPRHLPCLLLCICIPCVKTFSDPHHTPLLLDSTNLLDLLEPSRGGIHTYTSCLHTRIRIYTLAILCLSVPCPHNSWLACSLSPPLLLAPSFPPLFFLSRFLSSFAPFVRPYLYDAAAHRLSVRLWASISRNRQAGFVEVAGHGTYPVSSNLTPSSFPRQITCFITTCTTQIPGQPGVWPSVLIRPFLPRTPFQLPLHGKALFPSRQAQYIHIVDQDPGPNSTLLNYQFRPPIIFCLRNPSRPELSSLLSHLCQS
ncbi:hypothetical protein GGS23DRAFT_185200 [Durotheca rogersii]|uniref:uncharacterized protein n=1 Tax=Durotheca rogersii TaxID=419775 RepID=UPI00222080A8|nr:uncharacterized protein GGS23DRAFT_185200 [Durotheca rogersii]KAI5867598.1 hypothetical protein GGS23DRAFT_185200 [Durotheca rogersii]